MFAVNQDDGLDRRHAELVIRELAKFHAISFCMKYGSNDRLLDAYPYLQVVPPPPPPVTLSLTEVKVK